jgi:CRP/FNR family transcriptional regulator, anaerobic regulatory protein
MTQFAPLLKIESAGRLMPCHSCVLRGLDKFRDFSPAELDFVSHFKVNELHLSPGSTIFEEQRHSAHLFTLLGGWAFRYKLLEDGRRQILNFVLPGDLLGLQGSLMGEMQHSVEALTAVRLCVFERERLAELYRQFPSLAFDITWLASREERMLDEHLLSVGRRSAIERAAYLLVFLFDRARSLQATDAGRILLPISQQHVADTLGLSIVHTNKTLRKLAERGLIRWQGRACNVLDEQGLRTISGWHETAAMNRPFI